MSRYRWGLGALLGAFLAVAHGSVAIGLPAVGPDTQLTSLRASFVAWLSTGRTFALRLASLTHGQVRQSGAPT